MSPQENKAAALKLMRSFGSSKFEASLIADDATFWSARAGTRTKTEFIAMLGKMRPLIAKSVTMTIVSATADEDRVSVESKGDSTLTNGRKYDNTYHFMFVFRDGKIVQIREYNDTRLAVEAFGDV
jgi:ketosteroid isomerase-like protein